MARDRTLLQLLDEFRDEAGKSGNPAHNKGARDAQVRLLQRVQRRLWEDTNWPHLLVFRDLPLEAGQRLLAPHADLTVERISSVEYFSAGRWRGLSQGIGADEYSTCNSDLDERRDPVERFDIREGEAIEVWPVPATGSGAGGLEGTLRIWGYRKLRKFVDDGDRCDLDGSLIVLHAALEVLADRESSKAQLISEKLRRLEKSLFTQNSKTKQFALSQVGAYSEPLRRPRAALPAPIYKR